jgi:hypothetical protein
MNITQNIKDVLFPLKVMWIALTLSIVVQNFVYIYSMLNKEVSLGLGLVHPYGYFYIFAIACFTFVVMFKSKFFLLIKGVDPKRAPFTKNLTTSEQEILKFYPKYFLYHLIIWIINDFCVIIGFIFSFITQNYTYLFVSSIFAISFNIFKTKPDYLRFCKEKIYYGK